MVAEGAVDFSAEPEVSLWDIAPLKIIVEEAGGTFTDLAGDGSPDRGSIVCTNGRIACTRCCAGCCEPPDSRQ